MHRKLVLAIKRARNIALLPFAAVDTNQIWK
jgi:ribosomal protein S18